MAGLLADGWFYISSAGLLVSGVLFFFLLGQYRAATDAADQPDSEAATEAHPVVRPLSIPEGASSPAPAKVASYSPFTEKTVERSPAAEKPAVATPPSEPAAAPVEKRRENTTGGVNPAVVYLQNIKTQLEEIHRENRELAKRVEAITSRDEALIERLAELAQAVAELKSSPPSVPAPAQEPVEPAPKRAKKSAAPPVAAVAQAETASAPQEAPAATPAATPITASAAENPGFAIELTTVSGVPEKKTEAGREATAQTLFSPDETVRLDLKPAAAAAPAPAEPPSPVPGAAEESEPEKPRRGPVWPV